MKGICLTWSRGRLISPSLPVGDDWYLNLSSQKRPPGRNLGEHRSVRRSGTASRCTVLLVFCLRMRSFPRTEVFSHISEKKNKGKVDTPLSRISHLPHVREPVIKIWKLEIAPALFTLPKAVLMNLLPLFFFCYIKGIVPVKNRAV